jgi:hypothetical protein
MKIALLLPLLFLLSPKSNGQELSSAFTTIPVNKQVKEFPDKYDLSSPLKSCISYYYLLINGKDHLLQETSTLKNKYYLPVPQSPDSKLSEEEKANYLNSVIREVITYKDSFACSILEIRPSYYLIRGYNLENGKWVNAGEDGRKSIEESRQHFIKYASTHLQELRQINAISCIPADTLSFINFVKKNGLDPKEFVLKKLENYKLVIFGEIHRRKVSWDLLMNVINDKRFACSTGVVYLEMASDKQQDIDRFLSNDTINKELLLDIFRDYMVDGWNDKGKFDFIVDIWKLNKKLPYDKKIRIVAADTPRPFSTYQTAEDMKADTLDRDVFMAKTILKDIEEKKDKRNALFIVGASHVGKTWTSAGSLLAKEIPRDSYTIFTHCPRMDNFIDIPERIRHGIFDYAFYKSGDRPVAFELKNSPFGKEPFDGLYYDGSGSFQDNYDGYIFLGSLDQEPDGEMLPEMYNDKFILEMDRRYRLIGTTLKVAWGLKDLNKNAVMEKISEDRHETKWGYYLKPLQEGKTVQ